MVSNHMSLLTLCIFYLSIKGVTSLYVYDCAADGLNITTLSLLDVEPCPEYTTHDVIQHVDIQVLQQRETYDVHVYRCSIHYRYQVTYCGMHSHVSRVHDGDGYGLWNVNAEECKEMYKSRRATILGVPIVDLKPNSSDVRNLVLAGYTSQNGACQGSSLTLGGRHWDNVYATVELDITLHDFTGIHRISDNTLVTPYGVTCQFSDGSCMDVELGFLCWSTDSRTKCDRTSYHVLYTGQAQKIIVTEQSTNSIQYTMYSVISGNFLATLVKHSTIDICGMEMYTTDHSKLIIQEIHNGVRFFSESAISAKDMDLFLYVNAKFTHLEQHTRHELTTMYTLIMKEACDIKRHSLKTLLTIAAIDPVEFAYTYMGKPGYTALLMGETINIIQCKPVYVTKAQIENCYLELPVNYSGNLYFMTPKSHILQKTGTPLTCTPFMQPNYKLENKWFASGEQLVLTHDPSKMAISLTPSWTYTDAGDLAKAGIYSEDDISRLRSQIMYPSERKAISQTISAAINQDSIISDTQLFKNLITKQALEESVNNFFGKTWTTFVSVGTFFSGIFGIMLALKLIKIFFDTVVNTRGLYEVYGFGWRLMAGIWDAATTYLLSPHRVSKYKSEKIPLSEVVQPPPYNDQPTQLGECKTQEPSTSHVYPVIGDFHDVTYMGNVCANVQEEDKAIQTSMSNLKAKVTKKYQSRK